MKERYLFILLFIAMFLWGSSWPTSKILTQYSSPLIITFWRFFFITIGSTLVLMLLKLPFKIPKNIFKWIFLAGILNALYTLVFFTALSHGAAGKGGVLVTTMIPIISYLFFMISIALNKNEKLNQHIKKNQVLGLILGLISGFCLLESGSLEDLFSKFNILFLGCAFIWASLTIFTHKAKGANALTINFYINALSMLLYTPVLFMPHSFEILSSDAKFWINMFVVAFLSTVVGTSIYYYGIHILGSVKANSFVLITPASALICSYFILDEVPNALTLLGCALAIGAIYFINIYGKKA
ncbi:hypothetical protein AJY73_05190 [Campylobacter jejuni]|uniref:DMT family transporter n=1 Tax=Campylobacter jejuni TaxID=197 RepID=UPI0008736579|nr:DMT family transporter [Campylobacter jejuni]OEV65724.1 hypothetical protein AJY73_05190 [Campylobacter jejuni]RTJ36874.1 EamA/RhaT family transporter [Campylobacter jejuni]